MKEPWNIKEDDTRTADSLPIFIIFCEDEVSEPIYFKYFEAAFALFSDKPWLYSSLPLLSVCP